MDRISSTATWSAMLPSPAPYGPDNDAFCSGHVHDNTGGVIFQGGLLDYEFPYTHPIGNSARYNPASGVFTQITGGAAHWYPTLVAGVNDIFMFPGRDTGDGENIQKLAYGSTSWTTIGVIMRTKAAYPRVTLLPNGKLFVASPAYADLKNYFFDPGTNEVALAGTDVVPESEASEIYLGSQGTGVLLPLVPTDRSYLQMRFAVINGAKAWVKDLGQANPTWQVMGTRPPEMGTTERVHANATLLPTGQVFVSGGVKASLKDADAVQKPEIYDPETHNWLVTSAATVPRNYHGVALLLPDGRVWTAGASQESMPSSCGNAADCDNPAPHTEHTENTEEKVEVFTPWYVNRSDRPVVTSNPATMVAGGRTYDIAIGDSQGMSVERVVLIRAGSVTHAFDADQRLIQLDIVSNCISSVTVRSPYNPEAAPPGDYMVFALRKIATTGFKRWVPSVAVWTRIATPDRRSGAPILRYTGTPCTGANCPGWQRLDNNPKTVAIAAAGTHHDQALYQLHNDGWIWQYTGGPCLGASCAGWLRLDNNPKTAAIAAAGSQLYQLHNDGWILRYIGTPCAGDNCTGWQRLDRSAKTVAIAAAENQLYQLQNDGRILRYTGTPCSGESCLGWQRLDNNAKTVAIAAAGHEFYQLHNDGVIWRYTGTPCSGESCLGWQRLSVNTRTVAIAAASGQLYQLHNDGLIWRYTGTPCSGNSCLNDGQIWRYTGRPCSGNACFGWQLLSNSPDAESILAVGTQLFQRQKNGLIWRFTGTPCNGNSCPGWQQLNNNPSIAITAGATQLYQLDNDYRIWRYTGTPCNGTSCPGWEQLDNNSDTREIAATGNHLYQRRSDGQILRYVGWPCAGENCPGWRLLDNNPLTTRIAVGGFN